MATKEYGNVYQYKVAPRNEAAFEEVVNELIDAVMEEEFPTGNVKTYAFYKVPFIFGYWYSFTQLTEEGMAKHLKGPKASAALEKVKAMLVKPLEHMVLDSVIIQGCGERIPIAPARPADADPATDVGVVYSFRVEPEDDERLEAKMREIFKIVDRAEISTGNVLTYNLYRDPSAKGNWVMFEHFTAKGSADHATDPEIFGPGFEQVEMLPEPFSRVLLNPYRVYGCGEPLVK